MGSFQFNGAISGSILNNPLGDARFYEHNGQITLASDGGQGVVTLTTGANQAATLAHSVPMSATAPAQNVALGGRVISISDQDLTAVLNSRSDSSLTLHSGNSGRYSDRFEAVHLQTGGTGLVVLADTTGNGLATFQVDSNGTMVEQNQVASQQAAFTGQISALSVVTQGSNSFVLAASASNHSITAYAVSSNGTLSPASTLGAQQFLPIATPQDMATVSVQGQSYIVLASAGTGSLTVLTLDSAGVLSPVDQVADSLNTRFQGAQVLESFTHQRNAYVIAAGQDSGLSLFRFSDDGQLVHLDTIADQVNTPINSITDMYVDIIGGDVQLFTVSGSEAGIGHFTLSLSTTSSAQADVLFAQDTGQALNGGAGDDLLRDGAGVDQLTGGTGADTFMLIGDGGTDRITDFELGQDRLDLSHWAGFTHVQQLTVTSTATGAILSFNNEQLVVDSANGLTLSATDFTNANVIALPQTDLSATLAAETNFTVSHQALTTGLTGQHNWAVQTHTAAAVYAAQQMAGQTAATASSDSFVFLPQGMPLATELEATIDTLALQNIQGLLDEGSDQTPTAGPAQATLISAAAEFRIANYDAADIDQFVFFQS